MDLILASTSAYRRQLLERLQLPFRCIAPDTDETPHPGETPQDLAARLALAKAAAVADRHPHALVIGSDQVAAVGGRVTGKPGNHDTALAQLRASSGQWVQFHTAVALVRRQPGFERCQVRLFEVLFRDLSDAQIDNYLRREQPYDCAGSFKAEGLGIALFAALSGDDPTALEGLPLIALTGMLAEAGVAVI